MTKTKTERPEDLIETQKRADGWYASCAAMFGRKTTAEDWRGPFKSSGLAVRVLLSVFDVNVVAA